MRFIRLLLPLVIAGTGLTASAAHAEEGGLRATALAGLERTDSAPGNGAQDAFYYGGQVGYDWDLGGITAGFESELGGSTGHANIVGGRARQGVFANAAVRVAVPVSERMRVFARAGFAYHEITYSAAPAFHGSGYTVGAGGEVDLTHNLYLRGEYRFSDYGSTVRGQHFIAGLGIKF